MFSYVVTLFSDFTHELFLNFMFLDAVTVVLVNMMKAFNEMEHIPVAQVKCFDYVKF